MEIRRTPYRPLRIGLLIYDMVRMFIMLDMLLAVIPLGEEPWPRWFPFLVYAAPQALFPLMGLFLLIRPGEYRPFIQLYLAGKTVSLVSALGWTVFSLQALITADTVEGAASFRAFLSSLALSREFLSVLGGLLLLSVLDALSLLGGALLKKRLEAESPAVPREAFGEQAVPSGGDLP
jgi:hypothetical protein